MRIPSLLKIKKQVLARYPDDSLERYDRYPGVRLLKLKHAAHARWWDGLRKKHCARAKAGEDMSVPCTCEAIAKKHKERMARHQAIVDQINAIYGGIWKPIHDARKLMESQLLVARTAKMRIKEARCMPSKEPWHAR